MRPFFGYHMPNYTFQDTADTDLFDRVVELAQAAEKAGFDMVTVMDHFYQIGVVGLEEEPMLEGYAVLSALAMRTNRVLLGTMVSGVTYRNPAMLAKIVTTIDVISRGRAVLGLGAAWNESEHAGYGFEFPPIGRREDRLEEALTIIRAMFDQERPSFEGTYFRIDRALNRPRPIQPGGPKILVGGAGEKRTLKLAARFADMTNWFGALEDAAPKLAVLDRHCEAVGRDPAQILRTVSVPIVLADGERDKAAVLAAIPAVRRGAVVAATVSESAEMLHRYMDAGFGGFIFRNATTRTPEAVARVGELIEMMRSKDGAA
ncbi:MAG: LLM class F420-dependent oxidoreductase [Candidatus Limnocylindrales bacterium]|jgi:F420-dependent oxidoreductase-like protein